MTKNTPFPKEWGDTDKSMSSTHLHPSLSLQVAQALAAATKGHADLN